MKITRIKIDKYGPLTDIDLKINHGFQCIYGPNESGKTLLIDAILKMGLGKKQPKKIREQLDRVAGNPIGWITLQKDRKDYAIDMENTLSQEMGIQPDELRDIFIIRNSDLQILDEKHCFNQITEKILNLRTQDISKIQDEIREKGRITKTTGELKTAGGSESPKNQLEIAEKLQKAIESYLEEMENKPLEEVEHALISKEIRRVELVSKVEKLKVAEKGNELVKLKNAIEGILELNAEQDNLTPEKRKELEELLESHEKLTPERMKLERDLHLFRHLSFFGILILFSSILITLYFSSGVFGVLQSSIILLFCLFVTWTWLKRSNSMSMIETTSSRLIHYSREFTQESGTEEEIVKSLKQYLIRLDAAMQLRGEHLGAIKHILNPRSSDLQKIIEIAQEKVQELQAELVNCDYRDYSKVELNETQNRIEEILGELKSIRKSLKNHQDRLSDFEREFKRIKFEIVIKSGVDITVDSIDSLRRVTKYLRKFIELIKREAMIADLALRVFDAINKEEESKVSELLTKGSRASEVFAKITGGSYSEIKYGKGKRLISVIDRDGQEFTPIDLSRGTKDQLYLSIRVTMGEKLLENHQGFFVMDDPFIASDLDRLEKQYEVLAQLVKVGWQIIFFTAREDLARSLSNKFQTPIITLSTLRKL